MVVGHLKRIRRLNETFDTFQIDHKRFMRAVEIIWKKPPFECFERSRHNGFTPIGKMYDGVVNVGLEQHYLFGFYFLATADGDVG